MAEYDDEALCCLRLARHGGRVVPVAELGGELGEVLGSGQYGLVLAEPGDTVAKVVKRDIGYPPRDEEKFGWLLNRLAIDHCCPHFPEFLRRTRGAPAPNDVLRFRRVRGVPLALAEGADPDALGLQCLFTLAVLQANRISHNDLNASNWLAEPLPKPVAVHYNVGGRVIPFTMTHRVVLLDFGVATCWAEGRAGIGQHKHSYDTIGYTPNSWSPHFDAAYCVAYALPAGALRRMLANLIASRYCYTVVEFTEAFDGAAAARRRLGAADAYKEAWSDFARLEGLTARTLLDAAANWLALVGEAPTAAGLCVGELDELG